MPKSPDDDARKAKYWGPERNLRRRERYKADSDHRAHIIAQVQASYRKTRAERGLPVRMDDCRTNLERLPEVAHIRETQLPSGRSQDLLTLTIEELATLLDRNVQLLYRWMNADLLPEPVFFIAGYRGRMQGVYLAEEARAIMEVFGAHQEVSQYYRVAHVETRARLFAAVEDIRRHWSAGAVAVE